MVIDSEAPIASPGCIPGGLAGVAAAVPSFIEALAAEADSEQLMPIARAQPANRNVSLDAVVARKFPGPMPQHSVGRVGAIRHVPPERAPLNAPMAGSQRLPSVAMVGAIGAIEVVDELRGHTGGGLGFGIERAQPGAEGARGSDFQEFSAVQSPLSPAGFRQFGHLPGGPRTEPVSLCFRFRCPRGASCGGSNRVPGLPRLRRSSPSSRARRPRGLPRPRSRSS